MAKFILIVEEGKTFCWKCPLAEVCHKLDVDCCENYDFSKIKAIYKEDEH